MSSDLALHSRTICRFLRRNDVQGFDSRTCSTSPCRLRNKLLRNHSIASFDSSPLLTLPLPVVSTQHLRVIGNTSRKILACDFFSSSRVQDFFHGFSSRLSFAKSKPAKSRQLAKSSGRDGNARVPFARPRATRLGEKDPLAVLPLPLPDILGRGEARHRASAGQDY